jgi:double-stranded uracil-DNA glycosylase
MLNDLLREGLKLVVCGTAAGAKSAELKQYYAGPGNKFWRTLFELGLTPRQLKPNEAELLLDFGIGLTDVIKGQSGADSTLNWQGASPTALREKVLAFQPGALCFNGKKAAQVFFANKRIAYGVQPERIGQTALFVAPSTSGAANGFWDSSHRHKLAAYVAMSGADDEDPETL